MSGAEADRKCWECIGDGSRRTNAEIAETGIRKRKPARRAKEDREGDTGAYQTSMTTKTTRPDAPDMDDHKDTTETDRKDIIKPEK